jgi:hypothetical protein
MVAGWNRQASSRSLDHQWGRVSEQIGAALATIVSLCAMPLDESIRPRPFGSPRCLD